MSFLDRRPVQWALGLLLGAVFIYASWDKILNPSEFARIVYHYQLIGPSRSLGPLPANLLAVTLPWIELVVGLLLATGLWRREAAAVAAVMLLVFVAAVGAALARGIDLENCGCFTVTGTGRAAGLRLIAGDLLLLGAAAALAAPRRRPLTSAGPAA
ncbi:MAG TPA: MauE/DoxX family redox-associated membrane protein [Vicinamibacteria bacterium]|nr:MauE/DoxX family redox-associated membrane protein [Vicinamibacteria bacterium]